MEPFRDGDHAAMLRAAQLEEENARLREELEHPQHDKTPASARPSSTGNPTASTFLLLGVIAVLMTIGAMIAISLMPRPSSRSAVAPVPINPVVVRHRGASSSDAAVP